MKTICTYKRLDEAFLARSHLEGSGIKAFIPDENTASSSGNNMWARGDVRLMVEDSDLDRAREVLGLLAS
jgi:hypothetical protein